ncbi:hypothetical protein O181_049285 [Austropuccinia psidii MF-1]|uniref:Integrase catalytic domain-containing protein n=1 Tax=Austropuccinia psidii MF-1 TaxID=1389203 RepID=A0A9Q3DYV1_9BASI|nr:hypothetical protein [Austropuccinia psidii MF-1]
MSVGGGSLWLITVVGVQSCGQSLWWLSGCSKNFHNTLVQHSEEECWKIHPEKQPKNDKPIKALMARDDSINNSNFLLDSGATTSMVNNLRYLQSIKMKKQEIELANGSIFFLTSKAKTKEVLKKYIIKIECQTALQVANIISNNGKEFVNTELQDFFEKKDISHLTTSPYTPEQNSFAKRGNRTTITKTRCLLKDSGLDLSFWAKAANTAVYLENLTPSKHLQPFGCLAIMLKQKQNGKFDETGSQGIFLGYGETHRSYRIMDPGTVPNETETVPVNKDIPPTIIQETDLCEPEENPQAETPCQVKEDTPIQPQLPTYKGYSWVPENESVPQNKIHGYVGNPKNILPYQRQSRHHANLANHFSSDPKTYQEAINGPNSQEWKNAIKVELDNINSHKVWPPNMPESHVKPLSTTWVFKQKTDENGNLSKFKARLCV